MKTRLTALVCIAALSLTVLFTGCRRASRGRTPPVGQQCTIQFRRDALGTAANNPVPPMTDSMNGAETSITGTLKSTPGEWVVLDRGGADVWIPKTAILLIKY